MQTLLTFTLAALTAVTGSSAADDSCAAEYFNIDQCCKIASAAPTSLMSSALECKQKFANSPESKASASCLRTECIFSKEGMLTTDNQLNKTAILKHFLPVDSALVPSVTAKAQLCFHSYQADIDPSLHCNSGAQEFSACLKRSIFLDCPSSVWQGSSECEELKAKVIKCPKVPVWE